MVSWLLLLLPLSWHAQAEEAEMGRRAQAFLDATPHGTAFGGLSPSSGVGRPVAPVRSESASGPTLDVLQTQDLKIAVMEDGSLGQPFYYAQRRGWTKLTYGTFKLNDAIKVDGSLVEVTGQPAVEHTEPGSAMVVRSQLTAQGVVQAELRRSYSFVGDGMILKITYGFTASRALENLQVYVGTSDDWIGTSDRPTKEQGYFQGDQFHPRAHGKILRVQDSEEEVFVFSPNAGSHAIILQHYGQWSAVYAATRSKLEKSMSDGAYAIYVPLGSLAAGETKEATIFYAAAGASKLARLAHLSEEVDEGETMVTVPPTTELVTFPPTASTTDFEGLAVLQTKYLKISVLSDGSLGQPFYHSEHLLGSMSDPWQRLTYGTKNLDYAIKVNNELAHVGGEAIVEGSSRESLSTRSQLTVGGIPKAEVLRSYSFVGDCMVLKISYSFHAVAFVSSLELWLGTSDDWIGASDRPTKEQGSFSAGHFVPGAHGKVLRVKSGAECVFVFSADPASHSIITERYGNWPLVYGTRRSELARSSSDGAYAIYVDAGALGMGETKEVTIFYAAAAVGQSGHLARVSQAAYLSERVVATTATTATTTTTTTTTLASTTTVATVATTLFEGLAVLQSQYLKFSVLHDGSLGQPFYRSGLEIMGQLDGWSKLTYGTRKLDSAIKVNGDLASFSGAAIESSTVSELSTRSQLSVDGIPKAEVLRSYSFMGDGRVMNITLSFTALSYISNLQVWLGTSDDWLGTTDQPSKEQGHFGPGGLFVPLEHGEILRVQSGDLGVFVFSPNEKSRALILSHYGDWPAVYGATRSELARSDSDGAYAIYVPLGSLSIGERKSATIFYAASKKSEMAYLSRLVAAQEATPTTTTTTSTIAWTTTEGISLRYVLQSPFLKIGVMSDGGLGQPFYNGQKGWTKLTYGRSSLLTMVKVDGRAASLGDGAEISFRSGSHCLVREEIKLDGAPQGELSRSYRFRENGMVLELAFRFRALVPLTTVKLWLGTGDDWIGATDQPLKERGRLGFDTFEASVDGKALRVHDSEESLFFFSTHPDGRPIITSTPLGGASLSVQTHSELASSRTDGAYSMYVPLGSFDTGQVHEGSVYYMAGQQSHLPDLMRAASAILGLGATTTSAWLETTWETFPTTWETFSTTLELVTEPAGLALESEWMKLELFKNGGLGQPFYKSPEKGWTKLTFDVQPLDCTVKVNGRKVDIESDPADVKWWDRQNALATTRITQNGSPVAMLTRSYSFKANGMVFAVNFTFTPLVDVESLEVWLGTSDDWVGSTDRPSKAQGDFEGDSFREQRHGPVLHIHSGMESVFMFSPNLKSHAIILRHYGRWGDIEAANQSALGYSTSDGSYAIYVPLGQMRAAESKSAIFYYAAAGAEQLGQLSQAMASTRPVSAPVSESLLVWDVDRCNKQMQEESVDCELAKECYALMTDAHSSCRVMFLSTMSVGELKKYLCNDLTSCWNKARLAQKRCEKVYPSDTGWLEPLDHYHKRYCGYQDHPTDLVNDHSTCHGSLKAVGSPFCTSVTKCYAKVNQVATACRLASRSLAALQLQVCSPSCLDTVDTVQSQCGHYKAVQQMTHGVVAYQRLFQCDKGAVELGSEPLNMGQLKGIVATSSFWHSKASHYLAAARERCLASSDPLERHGEACQRVSDCETLLSTVISACEVIWLPTLTVTEVSQYVCGGSSCSTSNEKLVEKCGHFERVRTVFEPVRFYQDKYCPSWFTSTVDLRRRDPDLINDFNLCQNYPEKLNTSHCSKVVACGAQISAIDRECPNPGMGEIEEMNDNLCKSPCSGFIERAAWECEQYPYLLKNIDAYRAYQRVFECGKDEETESSLSGCIRSFRLGMRHILASGSTPGAILIGGLFGISMAFIGFRSMSFRWYCRSRGYESLADDEQLSRLDEATHLLA